MNGHADAASARQRTGKPGDELDQVPGGDCRFSNRRECIFTVVWRCERRRDSLTLPTSTRASRPQFGRVSRISGDDFRT